MAEHGVHLTYSDNVAIVTLDRPDRLNTFNEFMWDEFEKKIEQLKEKIPRVVLITGAGKAFSAGFDVNPDNPQVSGLMDAVQTGNREPVEALIKRIRHVVDSFFSLPVPIIAAINGNAFGGGAELAVRCDLRVAEPGAFICFSEVRLGLMPDWGGAAALSCLLGPSRAAELILTSREIKAEEALVMGLVNRVSKPDKALEEGLEMAGEIAKNGPRAVRSALAVIRAGRDLPFGKCLDLELEKAVDLITSGECFHGISAFLTKKRTGIPGYLKRKNQLSR